MSASVHMYAGVCVCTVSVGVCYLCACVPVVLSVYVCLCMPACFCLCVGECENMSG